tara:strand:+ start:1301 stop:2374 length:1074 start_codon:yes stop_codon:yes gene_type:complete
MLPRTIITLGPSCSNVETINRLKMNGADCFRINLSHTNKETLDTLLELCSKANVTPCLDTQGAQLRTSGNNEKKIEKGDEVIIIDSEIKSHANFNFENNFALISINHWNKFHKAVSKGTKIRVDIDGLVITVIKKSDEYIRGKAIASGKADKNRGADVLETQIELDPLTKFDLFSINYKPNNINNIVFMSFVNCANDVNLLRRACEREIKIVAKIETKKSLINISEICSVSDAVLIDRGDLSREINISNIPIAVSSIIKQAKIYGIPVYVATNVLDSMMIASLPSRAEISDIYNLLEKGVYGLVLAAETAIGEHPEQSVAILKYMQSKFDLNDLGISSFTEPSRNILKKYPQLLHWL